MSSAIKDATVTSHTNKKTLRRRLKDYSSSYILMAPFAVIFITFTLIPVLIAIYYSFTYYNILQKPQFVGWSNYVKLLFNDNIFMIAIKNTLVFSIITGPIGYFLSFIVAWLVNELNPKIRAFMTLLFYAPALSGVTYIWSIILNADQYGYLNSILINMGIITEPIKWMMDPAYMKGCIIVVVLWSSMGVGFLAFIAGLQNVDRTLYEAAAVDGIKNRFQELWFVTLPSMRGQLLFSAVMNITSSFNIGDVITTLCGFPSSNYVAHTIMNHLHDYGTIRYEMGYACAIATILFVIMLFSNEIVQKLLAKVGK